MVGLSEKKGIVKADGTIPHVKEAMMSDAIGTTCGPCSVAAPSHLM
jgi:AGZA family xanthine/uracil permease-like MFS transporter